MKKYLRHISIALVSFAVVLIVNFALPRLMPGDPVQMLTGIDSDILSAELYDKYYTELGLDLPLIQQFGKYLSDVFGGSLGYSYRYERTVASLVAESLPATLQMVIPAVLLSTLLAMWLALLSARRPHGKFDGTMTGLSAALNAVPSFLVAMTLVIIFAHKLGWLPYGNLNSPDAEIGTFSGFIDRIKHLILPVLSLVIVTTPPKYLLLRNNAASAVNEKYMVYAEVKGLSPSRVSLVHLFPNVGQPFITMTGMNLGSLLGGSVIIETIFSVNGMGLLMSRAISALDYPVLQGCLTVISAIVITVTIAVDLLLAVADPKIRRNKAHESSL